MEPYDFGPVIPNECCASATSEEELESPIRSNFKLIAFSDNDRKFTVNLHYDGSWSFTFTNGDYLTDDQKQVYCTQIAAAQSQLESLERWRKNGRNIGIWDPNNSFGSPGTSGSTTYFPAGRPGSSPDNCSIHPSVNF